MTPQEFRLSVKHRLLDLGRPQTWLCAEVTAKTGRYCDSSTLKRVYDGTTKKTPIRKAICEILGLPEE